MGHPVWAPNRPSHTARLNRSLPGTDMVRSVDGMASRSVQTPFFPPNKIEEFSTSVPLPCEFQREREREREYSDP